MIARSTGYVTLRHGTSQPLANSINYLLIYKDKGRPLKTKKEDLRPDGFFPRCPNFLDLD